MSSPLHGEFCAIIVIHMDVQDKSPAASGSAKRRSVWLGFVLVAAFAFAIGYLAAPHKPDLRLPPTVAGFIWPPPPPLAPFRLSDTSGAVFDTSRLSDHWTLVFFGYTHCPDICPTTMLTLSQIHERLKTHVLFKQRGQVLFVSVDAARDTPQQLRQYTDHFDPSFIAATASSADLHQLTGQFGVQIVRVSGGTDDEYWFDHPASILLIGPDQRLAGVFAPPLVVDDIAEQVRQIVDWGEHSILTAAAR